MVDAQRAEWDLTTAQQTALAAVRRAIEEHFPQEMIASPEAFVSEEPEWFTTGRHARMVVEAEDDAEDGDVIEDVAAEVVVAEPVAEPLVRMSESSVAAPAGITAAEAARLAERVPGRRSTFVALPEPLEEVKPRRSRGRGSAVRGILR